MVSPRSSRPRSARQGCAGQVRSRCMAHTAGSWRAMASITPRTYSAMGVAWMPLAVVTVTPARSTGLSRMRSAPAVCSWIQRSRSAHEASNAPCCVRRTSTPGRCASSSCPVAQKTCRTASRGETAATRWRSSSFRLVVLNTVISSILPPEEIIAPGGAVTNRRGRAHGVCAWTASSGAPGKISPRGTSGSRSRPPRPSSSSCFATSVSPSTVMASRVPRSCVSARARSLRSFRSATTRAPPLPSRGIG